MSRHPSQQRNTDDEDWKSPLCGAGLGCDYPRAYFLGCVQFGRTRYRLDRLVHGEDPLDMVEYTACNLPCWKYCLLCFGTCYIGSGVYTGREIHRVRNQYAIAGNYLMDIVRGVCCQPCSLIRNEVEIRRRELNPGPELQEYKPPSEPPTAMGAQEVQPIYAFAASGQNQPRYPRPVSEGYRPEPNMATEDRGQVRHRSAPHEVDTHKPLQENPGPIGASGISPSGSDENIEYTDPQLLRTVDAGRSLTMDALDRRNQALSAISERESEEPCHTERNPILAQFQDWIQDAGATMADKVRVENGTAKSEQVYVRSGRRRAISSPPASLGLTRDTHLPIPSTADQECIVYNDPGSIRSKSLSHSTRGHGLSGDKQDEYLKVNDTEHNLGKDESLDSAQPVDKQHEIGRDQHIRSVDTVVEGPSDDITEGKQASRESRVSRDIETEAPTSATGTDDRHSDMSIPTLNLVGPEEEERRKAEYAAQRPPTFERRLSMDRRVASAPPSVTFSHGIRFDKRVAAPELAYANLDHDILKDSRVVSNEGHKLHADERARSTATLTPREHDLKHDKRVPVSPTGSARQRGPGEDDTAVPSSSSQKTGRDHSISHDPKVAQRAYQFLEHFLGSEGRNRAAANKDSRATSQ